MAHTILTVVLWLLGGILGLLLVWLLFLSVLALFVNPKEEPEHDSRFYRGVLKPVVWLVNFFAGVRMHVSGREKIPTDQRFLLICNHRSNFDPIVTFQALWEFNLAFISKEANFHIPIFGRLIRRCCFMAIDREDPRKAMKTIHRAAALLENDEVNVAVYPEGTRSKSCELLEFHSGVLKIAQKANVPVVVSAIRGTEQIARNFPWRRTDVTLDIIEVIPAQEVKSQRSTALGDYTRSRMASVLDADGPAE